MGVTSNVIAIKSQAKLNREGSESIWFLSGSNPIRKSGGNDWKSVCSCMFSTTRPHNRFFIESTKANEDIPFGKCFLCLINSNLVYNMTNKIGLTFLLAWFAVMAIVANYSYDRNVPYRGNTGDEYASKMCRLDIAYQPDVQNAPVVVWFHGGGLTGGSREIPSGLLTDGMVVVGVEYRLSPHVKTMEIVDDAAAAVAWVFDNIGKYGGDTSSIYIAGHSAGGYLVDMVGLDKKLLARYGKDADKLAGIIPFSGQVITHFETRNQRGLKPLQPTIDETAPLYHVRNDCAPILILSGDREKELYGRYEESAYFYRLFKLLGHPDVTLYELGGFDHGSMCAAAFPLAVRFIRDHEKK